MVGHGIHGQGGLKRRLSPRPVSIGLIGLGPWGRNYLRTLQEAPGVRLYAATSRDADHASLVPPPTRWYADWHDLLIDDRVQGVVIATPPPTHAEIAVAAIACGRPILVEKPLTSNVPGAHLIRLAAQAAGAIAHVDHIDVINPAWRAMRREIPKVGTPQDFRGFWHAPGPYRPDTSGRWDWGPHAFAACLDVAHDVPRLTGCHRLPATQGELIEARLAWASGASATLVFGNGAETKQRRAIYRGSAGRLDFDATGIPRASRDGRALVFCSALRPLQAAVVRFAAAIRCGAPDHRDIDRAVGVVELLAEVDARLAH